MTKLYFNMEIHPDKQDRGLLAELTGADGLDYISISTIAVRRAAWSNYTPTIPCGNSCLPTYIQLLGCFNESVEIEEMKDFVMKAISPREDISVFDLVSCGKAAGTIGSIYHVPGYYCFIGDNYCYVKDENNELYKFDSEDIPRDELWDFLTLNAIVYILSKGNQNLCYNSELKTPKGFLYKRNMTNPHCSLMYWDRFTDENGDVKFIRSLKESNSVSLLDINENDSRFATVMLAEDNDGIETVKTRVSETSDISNYFRLPYSVFKSLSDDQKKLFKYVIVDRRC